jgi:hypothetical protein
VDHCAAEELVFILAVHVCSISLSIASGRGAKSGLEVRPHWCRHEIAQRASMV